MTDKKNYNFDDIASKYRNIHTQNIKRLSGKNSYYFAEFKILKLKKYEKNEKINILDVGCGDGASELFFDKHFPNSNTFGIDISKESIKMATERKIFNAIFETYNGKSIPFEQEKFDVVFVACVLHHIVPENQILFLKEIFRVLKTGGRLYIFEHNSYNPVTRYIVNNCEFDQGVVLIKKNDLEKLLYKAGFAESRYSYILFFPRFWFFKFLLKLEKYLIKLPFGAQYYFRAVK